MRYLTTKEVFIELRIKILSTVVAGIVVLLLQGCGPSQPYQYIQSPGGQQMVVVHDGGNDVLMDMMLFNSLMSNGGYTNVIHHYHMSPGSFQRYDRQAYSNWHTVSRGSYNSPPSAPSRVNSYQRSSNPAPVQFQNTTPTPVRTSSYQRSSNYSGSSRPTFKSTSPSPSRSSSYSRSSSSGRH